VYACILGGQFLGRRMVYGEAKVAGLVVGAGLQGMALGFLLALAVVSAGASDGLALIGYALLMVVLSVAAMLLYVTQEQRDFSMLRAGLAMMGIPMLIAMGLQLFLPMEGTLGLVISGVFLAVSVGSLLYTLNRIIRDFPAEMPTEASFELTIGIVVFYWNLLSFLLRMRRR
jgi:FtsH-binding integral membrane protein